MIKDLKELYAYRQMIFSLVKKDLRGRYKGSVLGFMWTFINPLLQMGVYTLVFSIILRNDIDKYYLFLFVALVPWIFFSASLTGGADSVLASKDMLKKIYFPREVLPISYVTGAFVNMLLSFVVIFGVIIFTGHGLNPLALLTLPIIMLVEYVMALGIALLSSALTVYFRDLSYILGIIAMIWQYLTPIMTILMAWGLLGESLGLFEIAGAVLVISGIACSSFPKRKNRVLTDSGGQAHAGKI